MKPKHAKAVATALFLLAVFSTISVCQAEDTALVYQLLDETGGTAAYNLNVALPQPLLDYYSRKSHRLFSDEDFEKFVTPYALKPIADSLRSLYADDEDFANGALMIVHQIPYEETTPAKYPVETMAYNKGDCDLFSFIAASIMKAGGLNVVLLHYENETHMNLGVHLSEAPKDARDTVYSVSLNNVTYYVAESTGGNWTTGWRVGECPTILKNATAQIIPLEHTETVSPGQVSASFSALEPSTITLDISLPITLTESTITFSGQLTPAKQDENVTIYVGAGGSTWSVLGTTVTQPDGSFEYAWATDAAGIFAVRASWAGDDEYRNSISGTKNAVVIPLFIVALIAISVAAVVIDAVAVYALKRTSQKTIAATGASTATKFLSGAQKVYDGAVSGI